MDIAKEYKKFLILLILLNFADLITTIVGLICYGLIELNPLFSLEAKTVFLKASLPFIFGYFFTMTWKYAEKYQVETIKSVLILLLIGLIMFYFAVVLNNLMWMLLCEVIQRL